MNRLPGDPNLPPGCRHRDLDPDWEDDEEEQEDPGKVECLGCSDLVQAHLLDESGYCEECN